MRYLIRNVIVLLCLSLISIGCGKTQPTQQDTSGMTPPDVDAPEKDKEGKPITSKPRKINPPPPAD